MTPVEEELQKYPAAASPQEVLDLKPNSLKENPPEGPAEQISSTAYTDWTRPDGSTFVAPLANDETYERKGFKKGKTEEIPDFQVYLDEMAAKEAPKAAEPHARGEHAEKARS